MKIIDDFKKFAIKGNAIDLAVAVIIGTAFGKIVTSLVNDIIMPPIGVVLGGVNFKDLSLILKKATLDLPEVTWNYGAFLQNIVDFVIIAFVVFIMVKIINNLQNKQEEKIDTKPSVQEKLLTEIRDILKNA